MQALEDFKKENTVTDKQNILVSTAYILGLITISYNLIEGGIATYFGYKDETLSLFGFGVDSFIEVISAIGIVHMIWRMRRNPVSKADKFEKQALRITGTSFYLLTGGLIIGACLNIYYQSKPETTLMAIVVSLVSILTMYFLYRQKLKIGRSLNSEPIISDANCTKTCFYLSFILLGSSLIYMLFKIPYIDALGSLGIAYYAFAEGKEAFQKAKNESLSCSDDCH